MLEALTLIGSIIYIFLSLKEIYHQGYRIFFQTLVSLALVIDITEELRLTGIIQHRP